MCCSAHTLLHLLRTMTRARTSPRLLCTMTTVLMCCCVQWPWRVGSLLLLLCTLSTVLVTPFANWGTWHCSQSKWSSELRLECLLPSTLLSVQYPSVTITVAESSFCVSAQWLQSNVSAQWLHWRQCTVTDDTLPVTQHSSHCAIPHLQWVLPHIC